MEYFNIYLDAFKRIKDYTCSAQRKELNFFILFYFIFWLIIIFPLIMAAPFFIITSGNNLIYIAIVIVVGWIFYVIHAIPLLALIKRRLIDIFSQKANSVFLIYLVVEIIRVLITCTFQISIFSLKDIILASNNIPISKLVVIWIFGLINNIFSAIVLIFYIFLMVKKGNIHTK